jgi:hypothetical protein
VTNIDTHPIVATVSIASVTSLPFFRHPFSFHTKAETKINIQIKNEIIHPVIAK